MGAKRIAAELGCSRNTVRRWLTKGGWRPCGSPSRSKQLDGLDDWLRERFRRHGGNADVVRQELALEKGVIVSLRTVERAVAPLRRELVAAARATVRFETAPGQQLQIDFGERRVEIGEAPAKVFFFVATLGYSRRLHVRAYGHEKRDSWFDGMESAFRAFWVCRRSAARQRAGADPPPRSSEPGGRAASAASRVFPPLGLPRSRRRAVPGSHEGQGRAGRRHVKKNAIAGRRFATWAELEAHLESWTREIADVRVHGTLGEPPIERFRRDAAGAPEVDRRPSAVRHDAGSGAPRRGRLRRRGRWQRLFGAMAPDRRTGAGDGAPARCASSTPAGWQRFTPSSRVVASGPSTTRT